jgi:hypothetical protein
MIMSMYNNETRWLMEHTIARLIKDGQVSQVEIARSNGILQMIWNL